MQHQTTIGRKVRALLVSLAVMATTVATARAPVGAQEVGAPSTSAGDRPNILLLISDDQTGATWGRDLMPNVFRQLVDEGIIFNRAYVNTALCCPSRSEIMTGLYEHHTGVDNNTVPLLHPTIFHALQALGYRTALTGKFLNSWPCTPRPEFDRWMCLAGGETRNGQSGYSLVNPEANIDGELRQLSGYTTDLLANALGQFIAETPLDQPFFAMYSPPSPHIPANDPRCDDPVAPHRPPSYDEPTDAPDSTKPEWTNRPSLSPSERDGFDSEFARMTNAVKCLDGSIARVLDSLGDRAEDTVVFYISDNGYMYGEHRRWGKTVPYEESVHVPFVVRYPGLVQRGRASNALVSNVDIAPTIADIVGIEWNVDGLSLRPLLTGESDSIREELLLEGCQGESFPCGDLVVPYRWAMVPSYNGVVAGTYKYIEYVTGERELYDLADDPFELANLAGQSGFEDIEADMRRRLDIARAPSIPRTTILSGPVGTLDTRVGTYQFFSQDRFARFVCRVSESAGPPQPWETCDAGSYTFGPLPDGDYRFEVVASDGAGVRESQPTTRDFAIHTTGPAVEIRSAPPAEVAASSPMPLTFGFSSEAPDVRLECRLDALGDVSPWSACAGSATYEKGPGTWLFQVRAVDLGGVATTPPAQWLVVIRNTGPRARFRRAPDPSVNRNAVRFEFVLDRAASGPVMCRIDAGAAIDCSSGLFETGGLGPGLHRFVAEADDDLGLHGATTFDWTVDQTLPFFSIGGLDPFMNRSTFVITTAESEQLLEPWQFSRGCALDGLSLWTDCTNLTSVADGPHEYSTIAIDAAWNLGQMQTVPFVVDTVAPRANVIGPPATTTSRTARFQFVVTDATQVTTTCRLDGAPARACTSPVTYRNLAPGQHRFQVIPRDQAGNVGPAATWTWTITT